VNKTESLYFFCFALVRLGVTLSRFPSFISSCGFGFMRTRAPISRFASANWFFAMMTAEELKEAPLQKLERARYHINDFEFRSNIFLERNPFKLMVRDHRKAGKMTFSIITKIPIPPDLPLIIGDAIHNMRAALDIVLFKMAGHIEPKISFPTGDNETKFKAAIKERKVAVAGAKVVEAVRRLEAYSGGAGGSLHTLHTLDLQDKHWLPILAGRAAIVTTGEPNAAFLRPLIQMENFKPGVRIMFDTKNDNLLTIYKPYITKALSDSEHEAEFQPSFVITFREGKLAPFAVMDVLTECETKAHLAIKAMIDAFLDPINNRP
jgi:hypothetical protein